VTDFHDQGEDKNYCARDEGHRKRNVLVSKGQIGMDAALVRINQDTDDPKKQRHRERHQGEQNRVQHDSNGNLDPARLRCWVARHPL